MNALRTCSTLVLLALATVPVYAQNAPPPATPPPAGAKVETLDKQKVFATLYDLNLLSSLLPVKWTAPQKEKVVTALKEVLAEDAERRKKDEEVLSGLAPEAKDARSAALAGTLPTEELNKKIADAFKAGEARALQAKRSAVAKILPILKEIFTGTQKDEIERQSVAFYGGKRIPPEYKKDPSKAPKEAVQDLALIAYIERVLLDDATLPLLEKLKPVGDEAPKPDESTKPAEPAKTP
jgi:hypothetical protein